MINSIFLHRSDGSVDSYKTHQNWKSEHGSLIDGGTITIENKTFYYLDATNIAEGAQVYADFSAVDDVSGEFKLSFKTGANSLILSFSNANNNWFCLKSDAEFYTNPDTLEVDYQSVVLNSYTRYIVDFFERCIRIEEYFDSSITENPEEEEEEDTPVVAGATYVYKSGDTDFTNYTSFSSESYNTVEFPPVAEKDYLGRETGEFEYNACQITFKAPENMSNHIYFDIVLDETFADYSKLSIEAKKYTNSASYFDSYVLKVGYVNADEEENGIFLNTSVLETITKEKAVYEFDVSELEKSNTIRFYLQGGTHLRLYNIWLEK